MSDKIVGGFPSRNEGGSDESISLHQTYEDLEEKLDPDTLIEDALNFDESYGSAYLNVGVSRLELDDSDKELYWFSTTLELQTKAIKHEYPVKHSLNLGYMVDSVDTGLDLLESQYKEMFYLLGDSKWMDVRQLWDDARMCRDLVRRRIQNHYDNPLNQIKIE